MPRAQSSRFYGRQWQETMALQLSHSQNARHGTAFTNGISSNLQLILLIVPSLYTLAFSLSQLPTRPLTLTSEHQIATRIDYSG